MATITVRLDDALKNSFAKTCDDLGLDMTTAFTIFAKKMTREKRIPFDVAIEPFYSASNMKAIGESIEQIKQGKVVVKTMEELEAMENE
ncbi:MAG: type II toxin-antitoxin system RelB/DinJ family antitoxin [Clostridiales bacterium]|nr:type II toxin-antitoxin system RelB/DinJ family antitoxin [Clostridiales bacterium]